MHSFILMLSCRFSGDLLQFSQYLTFFHWLTTAKRDNNKTENRCCQRRRNITKTKEIFQQKRKKTTSEYFCLSDQLRTCHHQHQHYCQLSAVLPTVCLPKQVFIGQQRNKQTNETYLAACTCHILLQIVVQTWLSKQNFEITYNNNNLKNKKKKKKIYVSRRRLQYVAYSSCCR